MRARLHRWPVAAGAYGLVSSWRRSLWPAVWRTSKTRDSESCTQAITETSLHGRSRFVLVFGNLSFFAIKKIYDASMVHSGPTVNLFHDLHSNVGVGQDQAAA